MNRPRLIARAAATLDRVGWHTVGRRADVDTVAGDDLTLRARIVPWDTPARVTDDGRRFYTESWQRGSLVPDSRVVLYDGHSPGVGDLGAGSGRRTPIGRVDGFQEEADGLYAIMHVAGTARGRDVYELARTLGYVDVSLESDVATPDGDTVVRTAGSPRQLSGVAVVLPPYQGAFPGAVATARADGDNPDGDEDDEDDEDGQGDTATGEQGDAGDTASRASIAEVVRAEMARFTGARRGRAAPPHPLSRFDNFDDLHAAARTGRRADAAGLSVAFNSAYHQHRRLEAAARSVAGRAWVDQVTTDNPGLIPPAWITEVFGLIDSGRAGITALGGPRSPGDSGMEVNWPYYDGDLTTIVKQQLVEKTEINSVKVSFKRAS